MNTCKTCKYWGEISTSQYKIEISEIRYKEVGLKPCNVTSVYGEEVPSNGIYVVVDEYDGYELLTGVDFGCILHEVKE